MDRGSRMERVIQMDRVLVCGIKGQCPLVRRVGQVE